MKREPKRLLWALFALYLAALLLLLFFRAPREGRAFNLVLLATIRTCVDLLRRSDPVALAHRQYAAVNLIGNLAVFIPLGIFLPLLFRRQRRFWIFLATVILAVCMVELLQYATRCGSLDVDDLILNLPGACLGWLVWRLSRKKRS